MRLTPRHSSWQDDGYAGVRLDAFYEGTDADDRLKGKRFGDRFDVSQGGDDLVIGKGGDDVISFGEAFTRDDQVEGGNGFDTVVLEGDYSPGLELSGTNLVGVERLELLGGSYVVTGTLGYMDLNGETLISAGNLGIGQSLDLHVRSLGRLYALGGAGDDILRAPINDVGGSYLGGDYGDDVLIGGSGGTFLHGGLGSDTIKMKNAGDRVGYGAQTESTDTSYDTIVGFEKSGGKIEISFDSDTFKPGLQHRFHLGETEGRAGDITFVYDVQLGHTIVSAFTNADDQLDFVVHLVGNVSLTIDDFVFR